MVEYFSALNNEFFTGLGIFIALVTFVIQIYKSATTEISRENHKNYLLEKVTTISTIPIQKTGNLTANLFTKILNKIFRKPSKYSILDSMLWNDRSTTFFVLVSIIINLISLYSWALNYKQLFYHLLPFLIILSYYLYYKSIVYYKSKTKIKNLVTQNEHRAKRRRKENQKSKNKNKLLYQIKSINLYEYEIYRIFDSISLHIIPIWIMFVAVLIFTDDKGFEFVSIAVVFVYYGYYIVSTALSFNITRVLVYRLIYSKRIITTLKLVLIDIFWASIISGISYFVSSVIVFHMKIIILSDSYQKNVGLEFGENFSLEPHFWNLFFSAFLPSIVFLLFVAIELISRLLIYPVQKVTIFFFERVIRYNYHQYVFAIIIVLISIQMLKKIIQ